MIIWPLLVVTMSIASNELKYNIADRCSEPPAPVQIVSEVEYYRDEKLSIVDQDLAQKNREVTAPLRDYLTNVGQMTDKLVSGRPSSPMAIDCAVEWLNAWAEADALHKIAAGGSVLRVIALASLSFADLKILSKASPHDTRVSNVQKWLHELALEVVGDEQRGRPPGKENNVTFWAALAGYNIGLATKDRHLTDWAIEVYQRALNNTSASGYWKSETNRGAKALEYQLFALTPIILLRMIAENHGNSEIVELDDKLHTIVIASIGALTDRSAIAAEAKSEIESSSPEKFSIIAAALKAYACRFPQQFTEHHVSVGDTRDWRTGSDFTLYQQCPNGDLLPFAPKSVDR